MSNLKTLFIRLERKNMLAGIVYFKRFFHGSYQPVYINRFDMEINNAVLHACYSGFDITGS